MLTNSLFDRFRLTVAEKNLHIYGIHVYQEGQGTVTHRWRTDDPVNLYSASKAFTSMAVGICQDEGRLQLSDKVLDFFPEYKDVAAYGSEEATIRDVLHMAPGKVFDMFEYEGISEEDLLNKDWAELYFRLPVTKKPGEYFYYCNPCTYVLGRIVEKVSGEKLRDYLVPRLFTPFEIYNPQWHTCPQGHTEGYSGLYLRTEELARLGRMMLDGGIYNGKRIVSAEYIKAASTDMISPHGWNNADPENNSGYGYQLWGCSREGVYRADGAYGQYTIVVPDKKAVVTLNCHQETNGMDVIRAVLGDIVALL